MWTTYWQGGKCYQLDPKRPKREGVALELKVKKEEARRDIIEEGTKLGVENLVCSASCSKGRREYGAEPGVEPLV